MRTYEKLIDWIKKNTKEENPRHAAIWFVCIQEAGDVHELYSLKDIAGLFEDGIGKMTQEGVTEWLEQQYGADETEQTDTEDIERKLRDHFSRYSW